MLKRIVLVLMLCSNAIAATNTLHDKTEKTAPSANDETYIWDVTDSTLKKSKAGNLPISTATQTALDGKASKPYINPSAPADLTLDCFFTEMRSYLLKTLRRKVDAFWGEYIQDLDGLVHATMVKCFFSIHAATIKSLDGITGYLLTIADNLLRKHWHYSCPLVPISCGGAVDGDVTNIDMAGYYHPSAELEAIANEMVHAS